MAAIILIVARRFGLLVLVFLWGRFALAAQAPKTQEPQAQKQLNDQIPDESSLPEEDETEKGVERKYPLNPLEAKRNIDIGNQYWRRGAFEGALGRYKDATRYNPNSAEAFLKLGEAEEKLHHAAEAKAAYQKAIKVGSDSKFAEEAKKKLGSLKT